jgi:hypothetical protein
MGLLLVHKKPLSSAIELAGIIIMPNAIISVLQAGSSEIVSRLFSSNQKFYEYFQ